MSPSSLAEELLKLDPPERMARLHAMSHRQRLRLLPYWRLWAHDGQLPPPGAWHTWVIMAGRAIIYMTYRPETDTESATGRPTEIEITPEMIEAGVSRLYEYDTDFDNQEDVVASIFRAMIAASKSAPPLPA